MGRRSLLAVYAHPDDEAYGSAGTFAKYAQEGVYVSLISATRGEAGEIRDPALATCQNLGEVRELELRRACAIMGVKDLRFLGCRDGAVSACPRDQSIGRIVAVIRELRPQVVITFGPEGIYGHPDHVAVHHLTVAACRRAGDAQAYPEQLAGGLTPYSPQKLYFRVLPKHLIPRLADLFRRIRAGIGIQNGDVESMFAPDEMVTTAIDVSRFAEIKRRAIAAHRTQVEEPAGSAGAEEADEEMSCEYYHLQGARRAPGQAYETDLFAGLT